MIADIVRIIPAYAGSTVQMNRAIADGSDHPRIRGEHISVPTSRKLMDGSSPHTRGAHEDAVVVDETGRIIPAYAGSTIFITSLQSLFQDHPRIRGEHEKTRHTPPQAAGSSPHTRGAHLPPAVLD